MVSIAGDDPAHGFSQRVPAFVANWQPTDVDEFLMATTAESCGETHSKPPFAG